MNELRKKIIEAYGFTVQGENVVKVHKEHQPCFDSPGYMLADGEVEFICKVGDFEPADKVIDAVVMRMLDFPTSPEGLWITQVYSVTDSMISWLKDE